MLTYCEGGDEDDNGIRRRSSSVKRGGKPPKTSWAGFCVDGVSHLVRCFEIYGQAAVALCLLEAFSNAVLVWSSYQYSTILSQ